MFLNNFVNSNLFFILYGPYYKCKLELKSNSSKIFSADFKFIYVHIFLFFC